MKFDYFYKTLLPTNNDQWPNENKWDVFISAFNSSERVSSVFSKVNAGQKHWLMFPEYVYEVSEYPTEGLIYSSTENQESEFIHAFIKQAGIRLDTMSICVDITGFMRPHLLHLVRYFHFHRVKRFDVIYSEPGRYKDQDKTRFSLGSVTQVRPVSGFEGLHDSDNTNDLLLLGIGYDHELIKRAAEYKDYANIVTLWGFPSLRADMYQESVLRASKASEVFSGAWQGNRYFTMANDPFATASALREIISIQAKKKKITNLYLSPLATKPQALGFALYYIYDWLDKEASIIFPFADRYERETTEGISKIWKYTIELPV